MIPRAPTRTVLRSLLNSFICQSRLAGPTSPLSVAAIAISRSVSDEAATNVVGIKSSRFSSGVSLTANSRLYSTRCVSLAGFTSARRFSSAAAELGRVPDQFRGRQESNDSGSERPLWTRMGIVTACFIGVATYRAFTSTPIYADAIVKPPIEKPALKKSKSYDKIPVEGEIHISERVGRVERVLRTLQFLLRTTIAIPALLAFFIFVAVPVAIVGRLFVPASDMFAVVAPLFYHTMSPIFGITCVVKGQENIEKAGKPCVILCAPHQSSMDVFIAASFVPSGTTAIGKKELAYIPFFNLFLWLTPAILIDRSNTTRALETLKVAGETITEQSLRLILFPEGTRTRVLGPRLLPLKKGGFRMALDNEWPIVPVVISNTSEAFYPLKWWWKGGEVEVQILEPISTKGLNHETDLDPTMEKVRQQMLKSMEAMHR